MERDLNNNETTKRPSFWNRLKNYICCVNQGTNDTGRVDNDVAVIALGDKAKMGRDKPPRRRMAIGPNLPSFLNCMSCKGSVQREQCDANVRLADRIRDYYDDSNSPLWQLTEDAIKLYKIQPEYMPRQNTHEEESLNIEEVAGPSKPRRRKLASRRSRIFAPKEQESRTFTPIISSSSDVSVKSD